MPATCARTLLPLAHAHAALLRHCRSSSEVSRVPTHTYRCFALRLYVDGINAALPRSVGKMTLPEPPYGRVEVPAAASAADSEEE